MYAENQASNAEESKFRNSIASRAARFAVARAADARASSTRDSVLHLAAA